jgi:hypothetical protein
MVISTFDPRRKTYGMQTMSDDSVFLGGYDDNHIVREPERYSDSDKLAPDATVGSDEYEAMNVWGPRSYCGFKVHHYMTNPEHKPCKDPYFHKCMHIVPKHTHEDKTLHMHMSKLLQTCPATTHMMKK